jgi:hypothetical protein
MPTLYIIDKNILETHPWALKALPLKASDHILLTEFPKNGALYPVESITNSPRLILARPSFIYRSDKMAQDYLRCAIPVQNSSYPGMTYKQLEDKNLVEMLSLYTKPYPRPSRLYVAHVAPLNTTEFQQDDFILMLRSPMHPAQITKMSYNETYRTPKYGETTFIQKVSNGDGAVLRNETLHQRLEAILARGTFTEPGFIEATSIHYHRLLQEIFDTAPKRPNLSPAKLSGSCMGIGLTTKTSDSPTKVTHAFSPTSGADESRRNQTLTAYTP